MFLQAINLTSAFQFHHAKNSGKEIKFEYNSIATGTYVGLYKPKQKKRNKTANSTLAICWGSCICRGSQDQVK